MILLSILDSRTLAQPTAGRIIRPMPPRDARLLALFSTDGPPPADQPMQLLCEDHTGYYVLPFPCEWIGGEWIIPKTSKALKVKVAGWRPASLAWHKRKG